MGGVEGNEKDKKETVEADEAGEDEPSREKEY